MNRFLLATFLLFQPAFLTAQTNEVTVTQKLMTRPEENNIQLRANNGYPFSVTVLLRLATGSRYRLASDQVPAVKVVRAGSSSLMNTLYGTGNSVGTIHSYIPGCINTKPRPVAYLLPVGPGKTTKAYSLGSLRKDYFNEEVPKSWIAYGLTAVAKDTVFNARRGNVVEIEEKLPAPEGSNLSYSAKGNYVVVEHSDCTRARYSMFAKNGVMPSIGETVEAGDPLGIVGDGKAFAIGDHIKFIVYYPNIDREILLNYRSQATTPIKNRYVTPSFFIEGEEAAVLTHEKSYKSTHPQSVIFQEMRKKQIKRYKKTHGG